MHRLPTYYKSRLYMHIVPTYYKLGNLCIRKVVYLCIDYLRITEVDYLRITKVCYWCTDYLRITKVGCLRITKIKEPQTDQWKLSISRQNNDSCIPTTKWSEDEHNNQRWHLPQHKTKKEIIIKDVNVLLNIPVNLYYQFNDLIK